MCLPDSTISIFLEYFPIFSGKFLVLFCVDRVTLSVIDRIFGSCVCGVAFYRVAVFICFLVSFWSLYSSLEGSYMIVIIFLSFFSTFKVV